ncbi:MAG TPA: metallophosphoesterase [Candidatus Aquilonibacter sp.]|nr:metallophosphoesterase [Candidatus Aquilonibacter sp.]
MKIRKLRGELQRQIVFAAAFLFVVFITLAATTSGQMLTPVWVEVGPDGAAIARVVVNSASDCPSIQIDGVGVRMALRQPTPPGFRPACELAIPAGARTAKVNGKTLMLPHADPTRIVAFGDTGCRIKGSAIQDCNDPAKWPFAGIAARAASEKPQLMIHVGDYLYRESPCPLASEAFCGGTPAGDNWDAWNADFFTPAANLLEAVPWAFARGNHEDCTRSWRGWFYYLDPRPWSGMCQTYSPPYMIKLGGFEIVMLDSSAVNELFADQDQIIEYTGQLLSLHPENAWLVDHHPFWGFAPTIGPLPPIPISVPLEDAWTRATPRGYSLILSGHIHLFEFVELQNRPKQLVVGDGGTQMSSPIQAALQGMPIRGAITTGAEAEQQFGYTLFTKTKTGWNFTLKNSAGEKLISCEIPGSVSDCKSGAK